MIVLHSFFFKAHPKYLDKAVDMMRKLEGCGFFYHPFFEMYINRLRSEIRESAGNRDVKLLKAHGQLQIMTKGGDDYVARINFMNIEKVFTETFSGRLFQSHRLTPQGEIISVWKETGL